MSSVVYSTDKMKYLIAFDLDGTLLTDDKKITDVSKNYIKKLIDLGHKVVIATGRPYPAISNYYNELNLDTPIVTTNGGMIHNPKDPNFKKVYLGMDKNLVIDIFKNNKDNILDAYFSHDKKVFVTKFHKRLEPFIHIEEDTILIEGNIEDTIDVDPSGVIIVVTTEKHKLFENYIKENFSNLMLREFRREDDTHLYELYQKDISKREGLEIILDYYNMDKSQLIAFGDGDNDLEMLEYAYVSVAMINGREEAINEAKYITREDNNNDGAVHFLDHFLGFNTME